MSKKNLVEVTTDKDTGEERVKLNATPEEVARAIFSVGPSPNPKLRKKKEGVDLRDKERNHKRLEGTELGKR